MLFNINVDDFGIIHDPKTDQLERLELVLTEAGYEFTTSGDNTTQEFCGLYVHHDKINHEYIVSMPNYIDNMLKEFNMENDNTEEHPYRYCAPVFTPNVKVKADVEEQLCSEAEIKEIQRKLGKCRWIIDSVMPELTYALSRISCRTSKPGKSVLRDLNHLIRHMAGRKHPAIRFKATGDQLGLFTDASFAAEQGSKSRLGGVLFMGELNEKNEPLSSPIQVTCTVSKLVADSAAEAEYMALHEAMKKAIHIRNILNELGFRQQSTLVRCDNTCAVGLANKTMSGRRTKHILRRFHWVQEQVETDIFEVKWEKGNTNVADYFTKAMNKKDHLNMTRIFGLQLTDNESERVAEEGVLRECRVVEK